MKSRRSGDVLVSENCLDRQGAFVDTDQLILTDEERIAITRRASYGLVWTITAQACVGLVAVVVSGLIAGGAAAVSALIGAAAYFVPNALFAMRLLLGVFGAARPSPFAFFWGEAFKLGGAVAILGLAVWFGRDWLVWPALLFGLLGVLKGYVLLLVLRKLP